MYLQIVYLTKSDSTATTIPGKIDKKKKRGQFIYSLHQFYMRAIERTYSVDFGLHSFSYRPLTIY